MYQLKPPFEIYCNGVEISDKDGHLCTADNSEIAQALLAVLNGNALVKSLLKSARYSEAVTEDQVGWNDALEHISDALEESK